MKPELGNRDKEILKHIIRYCDQVQNAVDHFSDDHDIFLSSDVYQNATAMPIQTIGELSKHFSEEFVENHTNIPWREIRGMRNYFAHKYWSMDAEAIWKTVKEDIPSLRDSCVVILEEDEKRE